MKWFEILIWKKSLNYLYPLNNFDIFFIILLKKKNRSIFYVELAFLPEVMWNLKTIKSRAMIFFYFSVTLQFNLEGRVLNWIWRLKRNKLSSINSIYAAWLLLIAILYPYVSMLQILNCFYFHLTIASQSIIVVSRLIFWPTNYKTLTKYEAVNWNWSQSEEFLLFILKFIKNSMFILW